MAWAFVTKEVEGEDGKIVEIKAVSEPARALLAAALPALLAEGMVWAKKNVKLGQIAGAAGLPQMDVEGLSGALMGGLAQKLMAGKKLKVEDMIQGAFGFLLPRLQGVFGAMGGTPETKPAEQANPFLKELKP